VSHSVGDLGSSAGYLITMTSKPSKVYRVMRTNENVVALCQHIHRTRQEAIECMTRCADRIGTPLIQLQITGNAMAVEADAAMGVATPLTPSGRSIGEIKVVSADLPRGETGAKDEFSNLIKAAFRSLRKP
jgi:hypothetical protein